MNKHSDYLGVEQAVDNGEHRLIPHYFQCHSGEGGDKVKRLYQETTNNNMSLILSYFDFLQQLQVNI